jgi:hypothetical protein
MENIMGDDFEDFAQILPSVSRGVHVANEKTEFPVEIQIHKIPAISCQESLIGVSGPCPVRWGNYFWLKNPEDDSRCEGIRVANMWVENMEKLMRNETLADGEILIKHYSQQYRYQPFHIIDPENPTPKPEKKIGTGHWALVIDDRVPKDWLYQELCFTGGCLPSRKILFDMYDTTGYSGFGMWEYLEPETYHKALGHTYRDGYVTMYCGSKGQETMRKNAQLDFVI